jgi:predicted DsbA family dithiol-disulfide isomerase
MRVDIWSDIVCPWCYIGKRRFDQALASFGGQDEVEVVHHSFELDPSFDRDRPQLLLDMLAAKYRLDPEQAGQAEARVAAQAAADGLGYTSDRLVGNTFDAHRLVHLGADRGRGAETLQRLYEAHFAEGRPVFTPADLAVVAAEAGLDPDEARQVLDGGGYADAVRADEAAAAEVGISAVPFFVLDGTYGVSGAQPASVLAEVLREVRDRSAVPDEPAAPEASPG